MRGFEAELHGGLIGRQAEVGQKVADFLLAGVEDLAGRGLVDGVGDVVAEFLKMPAQLLKEGVGGQLGLGGHSRSKG